MIFDFFEKIRPVIKQVFFVEKSEQKSNQLQEDLLSLATLIT